MNYYYSLLNEFSLLTHTHKCTGMTAAQLRMSQTIGQFYDDTIIMGPGGQEYKKVIERLDEDAKTDMVK